MSALGQKRTCAAQKAMSALTPKADMCGAPAHVRFVPIADIDQIYSITSSARASSAGGIVNPKILAVWTLITSSNLEACACGTTLTHRVA